MPWYDRTIIVTAFTTIPAALISLAFALIKVMFGVPVPHAAVVALISWGLAAALTLTLAFTAAAIDGRRRGRRKS